MARYRVVTKNGVREISQVDPRKVAAAARSLSGGTEETRGSVAFKELLRRMHEKSAAWAIEQIALLGSLDEIDAVRDLESRHPRKAGGRSTVNDAITAREKAILEAIEEQTLEGHKDLEPAGEPAPMPGAGGSDPLPEPGEEFLCIVDGCEFVASSEAGLEAHLDTHEG